MTDALKKLTCKNPNDYEPMAYDVLNKPNVELFEELVNSDDYLYDFVKDNVSKRLLSVTNENNYLNLLSFLKYYSPYYEDFIVSKLVEYADEDLVDKLLDIFQDGNENEKTYCAKFFEFIQDPLALDLLKTYAYSDNSMLSSNCASTLKAMKDDSLYKESLTLLNSEDGFEQLKAVKFLCAYKDKNAIKPILSILKKSVFSENIAYEIPYFVSIAEIMELCYLDGLYLLNIIIDALGEVIPLNTVIDFQLYDVFEKLIHSQSNSKQALTLLNAKNKFDILTENNEYLFDESKDVKQEIQDIKQLLNKISLNLSLIDEELDENSYFVNEALLYSKNFDKIKTLLNAKNQTLILNVVDTLKNNNVLTKEDKEVALNNVTDENIKNIINAIKES